MGVRFAEVQVATLFYVWCTKGRSPNDKQQFAEMLSPRASFVFLIDSVVEGDGAGLRDGYPSRRPHRTGQSVEECVSSPDESNKEWALDEVREARVVEDSPRRSRPCAVEVKWRDDRRMGESPAPTVPGTQAVEDGRPRSGE